MPLPFLAIAAGAQILGSGYKTIKGFSDLAKANKAGENLVRPKYNIEDEYYNNVGLAENMAQSGLTQESKDYYGELATRGLGSSADAILRAGGNANSLQSVYDTYLQGNERIAAEDSQLQNNNIKYLIDQNGVLAGQKTQQWALNEYEPYKDQAKAIAEAKAAAQGRIDSGISGITGAASTFATSQAYKGLLANPGAAQAVTAGNTLMAPAGAAASIASSVAPTPVVSQLNPNAVADDYISSAMEKLIRNRYSTSPFINNFTTSNRASA